MSDLTPEGDRRIAQRRRVLKAGQIVFNEKRSTLPCRVRNVSDTGAQLEFDLTAVVAVPDVFDLIIELDAISVPCRIARRHGGLVGVRFDGPIAKIAKSRAQVVCPTSPEPVRPLRRKPITQ